SRETPTDASAAGKRLAAAVWKPVQAKRIIIIADGALQYVPFGALPSASGEPLIVKHEIAYLPSASVIEAIRETPRRVVNKVAVFADPVFTKNDPRVSGGQPPSAVQTDAPVTRGGPYTRLRFSREEADAIVRAGGAQTFQ